jgi:hypothetical protein
MSTDVLTLGNIGNPKHKLFLRKVSDIFDNHRGNIPDDLAITRFRDQSNHTIMFNTMSPDLNNKQLILVNNNDNVLLAPIDIQSVLCSDKRNNKDVNLIIQKNNKNTWEATSDEGLIKLLLRFEDPKVTINGFSIQFADSTRTKYKIGFTMVNDQNEIISQATGMITSYESNLHQFFQFSEKVEGVNRVVIDLEVMGTNIFEWKMNSISLYSYMNMGSLKALNDSGAVNHTVISNSILIKEVPEGEFKEEDSLVESSQTQQLMPNKTISPQDNAIIAQTDSYGTPLLAAPDTTHQYFDNLTTEQMTEISNIKRLYTVTDLHNGHNIYTFETNSMTKNLTLTFQPKTDVNKWSDDPEIELEKLVKKGYIKKGGFKNYSLTFYIKLDEITMTDQNLVWKYGGWLFNDNFPQHARATDVYIPVSMGTPQVFTEYALNRFVEMTNEPVKDTIIASPTIGKTEPIIPDGKWVGFQFVRQVVGDESCKISVFYNKNPFDSEGKPSNMGSWNPILAFEDRHYEGHTANVWGGINEIISVTGAKYVSMYGISLYEVEW